MFRRFFEIHRENVVKPGERKVYTNIVKRHGGKTCRARVKTYCHASTPAITVEGSINLNFYQRRQILLHGRSPSR